MHKIPFLGERFFTLGARLHTGSVFCLHFEKLVGTGSKRGTHCRGAALLSPQSWGGRGGLLGSLMVGKFVPLAGWGLPREEPPLSCGCPFCAESSWLCHAVDSLLAQRYKEVWLVLVSSKIRGKFGFSSREAVYPSEISPFSTKPTFLEK